MKCSSVNIPGFGRAIVCGRNRIAICKCGQPVVALCDWIVWRRGKKTRTCSAGICAACALQPDPNQDKHLCTEHRAKWDTHPQNPKNRTSDGPTSSTLASRSAPASVS